MLDFTDFDVPTESRPLHPTMGKGVAERTYLRRLLTDAERTNFEGNSLALNPDDPLFTKWMVAAMNSGYEVSTDADAAHMQSEPDTRWETWHEVAHRVALGNAGLLNSHASEGAATELRAEYEGLAHSIANGSLLMSGRHLQQGDENQSNRGMEVFTNCATSATSFGLFVLLMSGAGVGRDYSDQMMVVDWAKNMPNIICVLDMSHPDFVWGKHTTPRDAEHLYSGADNVEWFKVPDSREGWAQAIERMEQTTFENSEPMSGTTQVLILDFSDVRANGEPIMGMQGRPSSGPSALMDAIEKISRIAGTGMTPWRATLYIDHFLAEPVLVGGARRSARMSTKDWRDKDILDFVAVKRPTEYWGLTREEVEEKIEDITENGGFKPMSFLWSSNNSVAVDQDFWNRVNGPITNDPLTIHAKMVYGYVTQCAYGDGTGEPGFINVDRLTSVEDGLDSQPFTSGDFIGSDRYEVSDDTKMLLSRLQKSFKRMPYHFIVNPCGEIALSILGGFCVIADMVPFHCEARNEVFGVARTAVRALMRVNLMNSLYDAEVKRTNRIGVGITGIHEFAWKFFGVGFEYLVKPAFGARRLMLKENPDADAAKHALPGIRAAEFWEFMGEVSRCIRDEAGSYAEVLGVEVPHTDTTIKPSGSVSKLFGLTEGWHLPAMRHYIRWVQYHKDSPMLDEFREAGYPVKELKTYKDHYIVGFPTEPAIVSLEGIEGHIVTASEASMDDQFTWLRLGEFFYLEGGTAAQYETHEGSLDALLAHRESRRHGNQISYTMKYDPEVTDFHTFAKVIRDQQSTVRCASVMPQAESGAYEYLPEEQVSVVDYQAILEEINRTEDTPTEDVGIEHLQCDAGGCPIHMNTDNKEDL